MVNVYLPIILLSLEGSSRDDTVLSISGQYIGRNSIKPGWGSWETFCYIHMNTMLIECPQMHVHVIVCDE